MDRITKINDSSNIAGVAYDKKDKILFVYFKSKASWRYDNVPFPIFGALCAAPSVGKAFIEMVRDTYAGEELKKAAK